MPWLVRLTNDLNTSEFKQWYKFFLCKYFCHKNYKIVISSPSELIYKYKIIWKGQEIRRGNRRNEGTILWNFMRPNFRFLLFLNRKHKTTFPVHYFQRQYHNRLGLFLQRFQCPDTRIPLEAVIQISCCATQENNVLY